jgi:hypothetical protein
MAELQEDSVGGRHAADAPGRNFYKNFLKIGRMAASNITKSQAVFEDFDLRLAA